MLSSPRGVPLPPQDAAAVMGAGGDAEEILDLGPISRGIRDGGWGAGFAVTAVVEAAIGIFYCAHGYDPEHDPAPGLYGIRVAAIFGLAATCFAAAAYLLARPPPHAVPQVHRWKLALGLALLVHCLAHLVDALCWAAWPSDAAAPQHERVVAALPNLARAATSGSFAVAFLARCGPLHAEGEAYSLPTAVVVSAVAQLGSFAIILIVYDGKADVLLGLWGFLFGLLAIAYGVAHWRAGNARRERDYATLGGEGAPMHHDGGAEA